MALIICEILREIGEMARVTSAWSSRGQTPNIHYECHENLDLLSLSILSQISQTEHVRQRQSEKKMAAFTFSRICST